MGVCCTELTYRERPEPALDRLHRDGHILHEEPFLLRAWAGLCLPDNTGPPLWYRCWGGSTQGLQRFKSAPTNYFVGPETVLKALSLPGSYSLSQNGCTEVTTSSTSLTENASKQVG